MPRTLCFVCDSLLGLRPGIDCRVFVPGWGAGPLFGPLLYP